MTAIKALIIDDESHCQETLAWELAEHCPQVEVVEKCSSAQDGIEAIRKWDPDLIFLDIEMPRMNGFEMLKAVGDLRAKVIFTTAYNQFAIKAFRVSALDYLVKPIEGEELKRAVEKLDVILSETPSLLQQAQVNLLLERMQMAEKPNRVALPSQEGLEIVPVAEILHADSDSNYTEFHFTSGRKLVVPKTLKEMEALLQDMGFLRIHHSHLVNLDHVRKYVRGDGGYLILSDGSHLNVSRSRKDKLVEVLKAGL